MRHREGQAQRRGQKNQQRIDASAGKREGAAKRIGTKRCKGASAKAISDKSLQGGKHEGAVKRILATNCPDGASAKAWQKDVGERKGAAKIGNKSLQGGKCKGAAKRTLRQSVARKRKGATKRNRRRIAARGQAQMHGQRISATKRCEEASVKARPRESSNKCC